MALLAYNRSGAPIALAESNTPLILPESASPPARGPAVNVTYELRGLTAEQYTDLVAQATEEGIDYVWTGPPEFDTGDLFPIAPSTGSSVCWAPYMSPGPGYFTDLGEAHAAVRRLTGAKEIQILADPAEDLVYVPGGTLDWTGITLRGLAVGLADGSDNRVVPYLLQVACAGRLGRYSFDTDAPGSFVEVTEEGVVTFSVAAPQFNQPKYVVGQFLEISDAASMENNGVFEIVEVVDDYTVKFVNESAVVPDDNSGNISWWIDNPTWMKNVAGLKDMDFRQSYFDSPQPVGDTGSILETDGSWVLFSKTGGYHFTSKDVGKPIRIGHCDPYYDGPGNCTDSNNDGAYVIVDVLDGDTFVYSNDNGPSVDDNNGALHWSLCVSPIIVSNNNEGTTPYPDSLGGNIVLDNVDFHFGGNYDWGSLYVTGAGDGSFESEMLVNLKNGASLRWYSCTVDSYLVVQSDGSSCWLGNYALYGNGFSDVIALSGMEVHPDQDLEWELSQGYTVYLPSNPELWGEGVHTVAEALDILAAAVFTPP